MMLQLISILFMIPISFLFYALSERLIAKHESRVGREVLLGSFLVQTGVDAWKEISSRSHFSLWLLFFLQCSLVVLFEIDVEYLIFIYLAVNAFAMICVHQQKMKSVVGRIEADRQEVRCSIGLVIALLCLFGCFTLNKTTSLAQIQWGWVDLFFVIPFQLAGMILFHEQPFNGESPKPGWVESVRFYLWSMLCAKLFLGGGSYYFDFHLKAAAIYLIFRVSGIYFPRLHQRDLLRVAILYLFPITGLLWLFAMLYGLVEGGVLNV